MRHGAQRIEDLWLPFFCVVRQKRKGRKLQKHAVLMHSMLLRTSMTSVSFAFCSGWRLRVLGVLLCLSWPIVTITCHCVVLAAMPLQTTNLTKGQASVHRQGMLWRLVRASMTSECTHINVLPCWGCVLTHSGCSIGPPGFCRAIRGPAISCCHAAEPSPLLCVCSRWPAAACVGGWSAAGGWGLPQ